MHLHLNLLLSGNHVEEIVLNLIDSPLNPLVFNRRWLVEHSPHLNWDKNTILGWSPFCLAHCFKSAFNSLSISEVHQEFPDLSKFPEEYLNLKLVFNKSMNETTFNTPTGHYEYLCMMTSIFGDQIFLLFLQIFMSLLLMSRQLCNIWN